MALTSTDETDLIIPLFDAIAEAEPFRTFLQRLQRRTGAEYLCVTLRVGDTVTEHFVGPDMRRRAHALGASEFNVLDRITYDLLRPGRVYSADEFLADDPEIKQRRAAHMRSLGVADERVVRVLDTEGASAWLIMARTSPCTAADSALLSSLAPYIERTLRARIQADRQRFTAALNAASLDRSGAGWIAFDGEGRVTAVSEDISGMLRAAGISLQVGRRASGLGARIEQDLIEAAQAFAADTGAPARSLRLSEEPRFEALLVPVGQAGAGALPSPAMIAHLRWPKEPSPARAEQLAALFGLARREAELAIGLADGLSLSEAGAEMGLTIETTRNYSKRLYAKLGVRGQAEVVRLVGESAAALA